MSQIPSDEDIIEMVDSRDSDELNGLASGRSDSGYNWALYTTRGKDWYAVVGWQKSGPSWYEYNVEWKGERLNDHLAPVWNREDAGSPDSVETELTDAQLDAIEYYLETVAEQVVKQELFWGEDEGTASVMPHPTRIDVWVHDSENWGRGAEHRIRRDDDAEELSEEQRENLSSHVLSGFKNEVQYRLSEEVV
jgi:hypothetical protein